MSIKKDGRCGGNMIIYDPFYATLKKKKFTEYKLVNEFGFSPNTFYRIKRGEHISTRTINTLCRVLDCSVSDIIKYVKE